MEVVVVDRREAGVALVADALTALVGQRPEAVLGLATGSSPEPLYEELGRRYDAGQLDLRRVSAFLLDEYVGLAAGDPASYRATINRQVVDRLGLDPARVLGPDGTAPDLRAECRCYDARIGAAGGVDLQLLGIGTDGHIGFNEPGSSLGSRTRLKTLAERTVSDNRRFFSGREEEIPRHVLTQGIGTILEARHLVLMAWGEGKADAIARAVEGPLTAMCPASALQLHPHATVVVDSQAARHLTLSEHYRWVYTSKPSWQGI